MLCNTNIRQRRYFNEVVLFCFVLKKKIEQKRISLGSNPVESSSKPLHLILNGGITKHIPYQIDRVLQ